MIHLNNDSWMELYDYNIATWKKIYKDCEFKVWGFEDVKDIIEQSEWCKKYYQYFLDTKYFYPLALISDYLRLYLLNKYGGLYVDTDVFALNRMPDSFFRDNNLIVTWDPGIRTTSYVPEYIKKYNIEKTSNRSFWRESKPPVINNGAFFFSKENNSVLIEEMGARDYFAKYEFNEVGFHCLSLLETLKEKVNFKEKRDYQKVINENNILILNSNYNAFDPEEAYFDYQSNDLVYNVHQCLLTGYNGPIPSRTIVTSVKDAFKLFLDRQFIDYQSIFIPVGNEDIEDFNEFSYFLRKSLGPLYKFDYFKIKPMPKL